MEGGRKGEVLNRLKRKEVYVGVFSIAEFRLNMHVSTLSRVARRFPRDRVSPVIRGQVTGPVSARRDFIIVRLTGPYPGNLR